MAQRGIEGRIAGIIRWLERFQSSYRSGALESALMDAECARADLEDLRHDLWAKVGSAHVPRRFWLGTLCRLSLLTGLLVLATATPLARESVIGPSLAAPPPALPVRAAPAPIAAKPETKVAPVDVELLEVEKKPSPTSLASSTSPKRSVRRAVLSDQRPSDQKQKQGRVAERRPTVGEKSERPKKAAKTVPHDKVFSLMQTGARALKGEPYAIKINRKPRVIGKGESTL